ncbi:MAG: hypothetical protein M1434_03495 [Chloroflexi bacterium]|nr:hypothetical protein [Chloroflexota bacterium]MCL5273795.1 hypothetical protein [Chloroflexota bacterium]
MKIPKYWAKSDRSIQIPGGRAWHLVCWQWSDSSTGEAQQRASARISEIAQNLQARPFLDRYSYGDRPLREEIIQSVTNSSGREVGVVTRNAYGALVLNAANAMFIDIDFPDGGDQANRGGGLGRLFGAPKAPTQEERATQQVVAWAAQRPDLGMRIYRTYGGLRCLITNQVFDPTKNESSAILGSLNSDPLYMRLCQVQECYRARLTPKPWRCGVNLPPSRYPWDNIAAETRYRQWQQRYDGMAGAHAACRLIRQVGANEVHPDIEPVLALHDQIACGAPNRSLA